MKVGVAGLGLIGGSLLRALGGVGYDADAAVREIAAEEGFEVAESLEGLRGADLVFVAVPPVVTADMVRAALDAVPEACVADTASMKRGLPRHERFVAAHPMAGAETGGWAASSDGLLRGATWAACPSGIDALLRLAEAVDALGGAIVTCTPDEHDEAVARTSHVPHLVAHALAGLRNPLAGTAFRDMTRVARADGALWAQILSSNRAAVEDALDEFEARLTALRTKLDDETALREAWLALPDARPTWREERIDGIDALMGVPVRRLRREDGTLHAEVAR